MDTHLKHAINNLLHMQNQGNITEHDKQLTREAIQSAYQYATFEEKQQLKQVEIALKEKTS